MTLAYHDPGVRLSHGPLGKWTTYRFDFPTVGLILRYFNDTNHAPSDHPTLAAVARGAFDRQTEAGLLVCEAGWLNSDLPGIVPGDCEFRSLNDGAIYVQVRMTKAREDGSTFPAHERMTVSGATTIPQGSMVLTLSGAITASGRSLEAGTFALAQSGDVVLTGGGDVVIFS